MTGLEQFVFLTGQAESPDVGTPQVGNMVSLQCLSFPSSDRVSTGRFPSAFMSCRGLGHTNVHQAPQERWSRGCRRADVSSWFSQWSLPLLLAPRKKKSWLSRSPSSRPRPASTSDLPARARQPRLTGPAPTIFGKPLQGGGCLRLPSPNHKFLRAPYWAATLLWPIRPANCQDRGQDRC